MTTWDSKTDRPLNNVSEDKSKTEIYFNPVSVVPPSAETRTKNVAVNFPVYEKLLELYLDYFLPPAKEDAEVSKNIIPVVRNAEDSAGGTSSLLPSPSKRLRSLSRAAEGLLHRGAPNAAAAVHAEELDKRVFNIFTDK